MKIAWLTDYIFGPSYILNEEKKKVKSGITNTGGVEKTNEIMIDEGIKLGHKIDIILPSRLNKKNIKKYDLVILNSITRFKVEDIYWLIDNVPYIKYEHDAGFCMWKNPLCEENCFKTNRQKCTPYFYRKIFAQSELNIFLSPLHLQGHKQFFWNELTDNKTIVIPSPLKKDKFKQDKTKIKRGHYLYLGAISPTKGVEEILVDFKDKGKKLCFVGPANDVPLFNSILRNGHTYLGELPYEKIPALLREYPNLLQYQTEINDPFCRTAIEGLASGCKLIIKNKNRIGAFSYKVSKEKLLDMCYKAPKKFWTEVEKHK